MVITTAEDFLVYLQNIIVKFENEKIKNNKPNLGVIYTPNQIVQNIVSSIFKSYNIKNIQINNLKNIRILDPACGSGRFLLAAALELYEFYRDSNLKHQDYEIKKYIIQNHLYGVDIEAKACFITKLRLFLWLVSNETSQFFINKISIKDLSLSNMEQIFERFHLKFNIFCTDFLLDFNIDKFDIIFGNPPYIENKKIKNVEFKKKLVKRFKSAYRLFDLSILFIEKSLELLEDNGYISFILPNKFLSADYGIKVRNLLFNQIEIEEIINISSLPIFQNTATYPIILTLKKVKPSEEHKVNIKIFNNIEDLSQNNKIKTIKFHQNLIQIFPSKVIPISGNIELISYLYRNFKTFTETFKDLKIIYRPFGFLRYRKYFNNISEMRQSDNDLLLIGTGNIGKAHIKFNKRIKIAGKNIKISYFNYNPGFKHVWSDLNSEKLIFREIAKDLTCCYDPGIFINITGLYFIKITSFNTNQLFSLLTILNSEFLDSVFKTLFSSLHMAGGYLRFNGSFIKRLPMPHQYPSSLSYCGKLIQFISQLQYDLNSSIQNNRIKSKFERIRDKYSINIDKILTFFRNLSNSLVKLLYLDEFYLKSQLDYNIIRKILYFDFNRQISNLRFKYILPRFEMQKYSICSLDELELNLIEIKKFFDKTYEDIKLVNQMSSILNNKL